MKYMLLIAADEAAWMSMPESERNSAVQRIGLWYQDVAQSGRLVSGFRLGGQATAKTVRLGPAGRSTMPMHSDGPMVESKELIGSLMVVEVANLEEALEVADSWPAGGAVEVRPVTE